MDMRYAARLQTLYICGRAPTNAPAPACVQAFQQAPKKPSWLQIGLTVGERPCHRHLHYGDPGLSLYCRCLLPFTMTVQGERLCVAGARCHACGLTGTRDCRRGAPDSCPPGSSWGTSTPTKRAEECSAAVSAVSSSVRRCSSAPGTSSRSSKPQVKPRICRKNVSSRDSALMKLPATALPYKSCKQREKFRGSSLMMYHQARSLKSLPCAMEPH